MTIFGAALACSIFVAVNSAASTVSANHSPIALLKDIPAAAENRLKTS
jgi:hypothetical protein